MDLGGPKIKVVLIQKGLLDNQNPGFCMGWPGLYLMDSIQHSRSVCYGRFREISFGSATHIGIEAKVFMK